jgi:apolipoprotein D and lipocalin family protein
MKVFFILILVISMFLLSACSSYAKNRERVETVRDVDLKRYLGKWYQFAYFPNRFQPRDCVRVTAEYYFDEKDRIIVVNTCWSDKEMKETGRQVRGRVFQTKHPAKLKVQFFWPFRGNYWIIALDEESYSYAIVSEPKRKYLWILTRDITMSEQLYKELAAELKAQGYDLNRLEITGELIKSP